MIVKCVEAKARTLEFKDTIPEMAKGELIFKLIMFSNGSHARADKLESFGVTFSEMGEELVSEIPAIQAQCNNSACGPNMKGVEGDFNHFFTYM